MKMERACNRAEGVNTKMLDVLTNAAEFSRYLGFARATHCKSGKDRTSMSATLEQTEVAANELARRGFALDDAEGEGEALRNVMRSHGVRREGVRCNVRKDLYAFNVMQRAVLPEELQPPPSTCPGVGGPTARGGRRRSA